MFDKSDFSPILENCFGMFYEFQKLFYFQFFAFCLKNYSCWYNFTIATTAAAMMITIMIFLPPAFCHFCAVCTTINLPLPPAQLSPTMTTSSIDKQSPMTPQLPL